MGEYFFTALIGSVLFLDITILVGYSGTLIKNIDNLEEYKEEVISRLRKLGYTLEEAQELKKKQVIVKPA